MYVEVIHDTIIRKDEKKYGKQEALEIKIPIDTRHIDKLSVSRNRYHDIELQMQSIGPICCTPKFSLPFSHLFIQPLDQETTCIHS